VFHRITKERLMSEVNELIARIEGAFTAVKEKVKTQQQQELKHFQEGQKLLQEYEKVQAKIVEAVKPRLQALAKRAGDRVAVTPSVSESRRSARFEFKSNKAYITLVFSVAPDREVKNAVVECDLKIVPVLWKFDSHAEFSTPVAAPDLSAVAKWLDDRIVAFVELYIQIHEGELYDKAEYVEDPIAKVKFPKFAAGAILEHGGQTYFFIDDTTKTQFAKQKGTA
jgi:YHS domain-containing protein